MAHKFTVEWQFWLITVESRQYKILDIAKFVSAENFAKYYYVLGNPSEFKFVNGRRVSLAVFREDVRPAWEAPENANGGHFSYDIRDPALVGKMWEEILLMLLAGELGSECNGIVCGIKEGGQWMFEIWMKSDAEKHKVSDAIAAVVGREVAPKWIDHRKKGR
jgi:hypothetical protein